MMEHHELPRRASPRECPVEPLRLSHARWTDPRRRACCRAPPRTPPPPRMSRPDPARYPAVRCAVARRRHDTSADRRRDTRGCPRRASTADGQRPARPGGRNGPSWSARFPDRRGRRPASGSRGPGARGRPFPGAVPSRQPRLGIPQVEEPDRTPAGRSGLCRLPGSPPPGSPVSEGVVVNRIGLQARDPDPVFTDDRIVQHARHVEARRVTTDDPDRLRARFPSRRPLPIRAA